MTVLNFILDFQFMNKHQSKLDEIWSKNKALLKPLSTEYDNDIEFVNYVTIVMSH